MGNKLKFYYEILYKLYIIIWIVVFVCFYFWINRGNEIYINFYGLFIVDVSDVILVIYVFF